jgi:hypothetical protein
MMGDDSDDGTSSGSAQVESKRHQPASASVAAAPDGELKQKLASSEESSEKSDANDADDAALSSSAASPPRAAFHGVTILSRLEGCKQWTPTAASKVLSRVPRLFNQGRCIVLLSMRIC